MTRKNDNVTFGANFDTSGYKREAQNALGKL
jgi:hypothetical protein